MVIVKPQVRGFIYGGAGRPAWAVGYRRFVFLKWNLRNSSGWARKLGFTNLHPMDFEGFEPGWVQLNLFLRKTYNMLDGFVGSFLKNTALCPTCDL